MRIGIVGSGNMGSVIARRLSNAGHEILVSNSRGPATLTDLVTALGSTVCTASVAQAIEFGEVVFLAVPYFAVEDVAGSVGSWRGKIVVDVTNYYASRDGQELDPSGESSSVLVADMLPGARVVKAFNTITARRLERELRLAGSEPDVVFYAGDDPIALQAVDELISDAGCTPVKTGSLTEGGRRQQPGSDIYNVPLTKAEAESRLRRAG